MWDGFWKKQQISGSQQKDLSLEGRFLSRGKGASDSYRDGHADSHPAPYSRYPMPAPWPWCEQNGTAADWPKGLDPGRRRAETKEDSESFAKAAYHQPCWKIKTDPM